MERKLLFLLVGSLFLLEPLFVSGIATPLPQAQLSFSPVFGTFTEGESFWIDVMANAGGINVNTVSAIFSYPEDKLEPLEISPNPLLFRIGPEERMGGGKVALTVGLPSPGFSGIQKIGSVRFRAKTSSGTAILSFEPESAMLADVGNQNVLILAISGKGVFTLQAQPLPQGPPLPPFSPISPSPTSSLSEESVSLPIQPTPQSPDLLAISDVKAETLKEDSIRISWTTNRATDSLVQYGTDTPHEFSVFDGEFTIFHEILLENPPSWQTLDYYVQIVSRDEEHREAQTENLRLKEILTESSGLEQEQPTESGFGRVVSRVPFPLLIILGGLAILIFLILLFLTIKKLREG